jgi:poly-gamma-glutamate synthesis protein (capsule biosynthesis protein)
MRPVLLALFLVVGCSTPSSAYIPQEGPGTGPAFEASVSWIGPDIRARMTHSWRPGCPVPLRDLRYVRVGFWDFRGRPRTGELVVHEDHAEALVEVFRDLFRVRFPVARMVLVDEYGGDDDRSMAANNTSAFNCRLATGGSSWSEHAYGRAIDVNPVQNPYVNGETVLPPAGEAYVDRSVKATGMIKRAGPVVPAFAAVGWSWGGDWTTLKDYQHFSATGR